VIVYAEINDGFNIINDYNRGVYSGQFIKFLNKSDGWTIKLVEQLIELINKNRLH
jgi:hypothetical protein